MLKVLKDYISLMLKLIYLTLGLVLETCSNLFRFMRSSGLSQTSNFYMIDKLDFRQAIRSGDMYCFFEM